MELLVGDLVVYGNHGIGRVVARHEQTVLGSSREVVVLELDNELTVTLPLELAYEQLRSLASRADLQQIRATLRDDTSLSLDPWLSRRRTTLQKLTEGDPVQLAEIVSEGAQRERLRLARGNKPQLSSGERELFTKARSLLSSEIALALDIQPAAADGWIAEQLTRPA